MRPSYRLSWLAAGGLLFVLACEPAAHAQASFPFTLKGQIGHLNAPAKVYLLRDNQLTDSTRHQGRL